MSATAESLLDSFRTLPEEEKRRVAAEILRWSARAEHPALRDDDLAGFADGAFLELETDERAHA